MTAGKAAPSLYSVDDGHFTVRSGAQRRDSHVQLDFSLCTFSRVQHYHAPWHDYGATWHDSHRDEFSFLKSTSDKPITRLSPRLLIASIKCTNDTTIVRFSPRPLANLLIAYEETPENNAQNTKRAMPFWLSKTLGVHPDGRRAEHEKSFAY